VLSEHWVFSGSSTSLWPSNLVWSDVDNRVRGTQRPPPFLEKLLNGDDINVTKRLGVSLCGWVLSGKSRMSWERLDNRKAYTCVSVLTTWKEWRIKKLIGVRSKYYQRPSPSYHAMFGPRIHREQIQHSEPDSECMTGSTCNGHHEFIRTLFWTFFTWLERDFHRTSNSTGHVSKFYLIQLEPSKQEERLFGAAHQQRLVLSAVMGTVGYYLAWQLADGDFFVRVIHLCL
jgi:hypothetical protein